MRKNKYSVGLLNYIINVFVVLLFWGGLLRKNFNADTLSHMYSGDADIANRLADGRYVIAFFDFIFFKAGIRTTDYISIFSLVALVLVAGSITVMQYVFSRRLPLASENGEIKYSLVMTVTLHAAVALGFLNVLFIEPLMFTEMSCYFGLAYLFASVGVLFFADKKYIIAIVLFLISVCTYQFSVVFAAIVLVYYILIDEDSKFSGHLIVREVLAILSTFGMGIINLILIKVAATIGWSGELRKDMDVTGLGDKFVLAIKALGQLYVSAYGLLLHLYIPLLFSLMVLIITVWVGVRLHDMQFLILSLVAYAGSTVLMLILPLMNGSFGLPGRMSFLFFLIQGLLVVLLMSRLDDKRMTIILSIGVVGYLFVQYFFTSFIITDKYVSNRQDINDVRLLVQAIEEYEDATGCQVTTLVVGHDNFAPDYYNIINFHAEQINERTATIVPVTLIKYATGRELIKEVMTDEDRFAMFGDSDWNELNLKEQLICDGDRAYWCVY